MEIRQYYTSDESLSSANQVTIIKRTMKIGVEIINRANVIKKSPVSLFSLLEQI